MKGTRVQSIIRELRGEKIDIVEWSEDPIVFVTNALSPAKVAARVDRRRRARRVMEVVVEDKQLSLAIGKKGQNVRLAAKLTGWRIDIKSEEEKRREVEAQLGALEVGGPRAPPRSRGGAETAGGAAEASTVGAGDRDAEVAEAATADGQRSRSSDAAGGRRAGERDEPVTAAAEDGGIGEQTAIETSAAYEQLGN